MKISDVIVHYNTVLSHNHRLWTYYQVVSLALIGFVWSLEKNKIIFIAIIIIYMGFSLVNRRLIIDSQKNLLLLSESIANYMQETGNEIHNSLKPVQITFHHDSIVKVKDLHLIISFFTVVAILIKFYIL